MKAHRLHALNHVSFWGLEASLSARRLSRFSIWVPFGGFLLVWGWSFFYFALSQIMMGPLKVDLPMLLVLNLNLTNISSNSRKGKRGKRRRHAKKGASDNKFIQLYNCIIKANYETSTRPTRNLKVAWCLPAKLLFGKNPVKEGNPKCRM